MFAEAEYVFLKGLKSRSPEEEARWQSVRQERRSLQQAEAKRLKRAAATEKEKDAERARVRQRRAQFTDEEAAAATKRNTDKRRLARAKAAAEETVVESVVETVVVVVPYTGEPPSLSDGEGRVMDEDMGRQDSTNSVVDRIIMNSVFDIKVTCQNLENTFDLDHFDM